VFQFIGTIVGKDYVSAPRWLKVYLRGSPDGSRSPKEDAAMRQIATLTQLEHLALQGGRITDSDLAQICNLTRLTSLKLQQATITAKGLGQLRRLTRLTELDARLYADPIVSGPTQNYRRPVAGHDVDAIAFLGGMRDLKSLNLGGRDVGDAHISFLAGKTALNSIWLGNTAITDTAIEALAGLPALSQLDVNVTSITDRGASIIAQLKTLATVGVGYTAVSDAAIDDLVQLPRLRRLMIGNREHPERITVRGIQGLRRARVLKELRLGGVQFSVQQLDEIRASLPGVEIECDNDPAVLSITNRRRDAIRGN